MQFQPIPELLQGFGVCERFPIADVPPVDDVAHGKFHDLAALGARDLRDLNDPGWHVPRRCVLADPASNPILNLGCQRRALLEPDEEDDALVTIPALADDETLDDLVDLFHLAIDLGRSNPNSARVQHGIGATVDDDATVLGERGVIAMAPHAREAFEIGGVIFPAVRVVPESDRHRREWHRADELSLFPMRQRMSAFVEYFHLHA